MSADLLTFDRATHAYRLPTGQRIPNVTEILRATGIAKDFEQLREISDDRAAAIDLKRDLGAALHADAHAYDDDDLDWSTVDPRVEPYLRAWVVFRANKGVKPVARERQVYSIALGYCGTLDGIFALPDGRQVLIDLKTGDLEDSGCRYQTAAYQLAYQAQNPGAEIAERWGVQLTPDRVIPYRLGHYDDWRDLDRWRAIVTTFYCGHAARSLR